MYYYKGSYGIQVGGVDILTSQLVTLRENCPWMWDFYMLIVRFVNMGIQSARNFYPISSLKHCIYEILSIFMHADCTFSRELESWVIFVLNHFALNKSCA